ncbi:MAG: phospholipase D-like domain-containing protein [Gammaproteobacteria bacterium]
MPYWVPPISHHFAWGAIALLVYVVTTRSGGVRRPPATAIAWVLGLVLLPYVLLPLYLVFGQRKIKAAPRPRPASFANEQCWPAAQLESFGLAAPSPAETRFHGNGAEAREALWEIMESAQVTLDVSTFLIADDPIGLEAVARLTGRARAGVRVRLMIDGAGAWLTHKPDFAALRAAGAQVMLFQPVFGPSRPGGRNLRNHRKLVVADDAGLWCGGRNLAAEYFCGDGRAEPWIDLSFTLRGEVAAVAARQYEADWASASGQASQRAVISQPSAHGSLVQFLPSGPDQPEDTAQALLVAACFRAQHRFIAVTPYFVPDESLLAALRLATLRGVQTTLVIPATSNHHLADFVRGRGLRALAQAGATIYVIPRMVHAKAVVVDDTFALCGSMNLDARSLLINYEAGVVFYGLTEIEWLAQWIDALAAHGTPYQARAPGFARDLAEGLLLTVGFQL